MKYIVTGFNGFIGRHLCDKLSRDGYKVICYDLRNPKIAEGEVLVHCANDHFSSSRNQMLTRKVFECAVKNGINRIVFFMSFSTLTGKKTNNETNLGFVPKFMDDYARNKFLQEVQIIKSAKNIKMKIDLVYLPAVFGIGGAWDKKFFQLRNSDKVYVPMESGIFNYCHVDDIYEFIIDVKNETDDVLNRWVINTLYEQSFFEVVKKFRQAKNIELKAKSLKEIFLLNTIYRYRLLSRLIGFARILLKEDKNIDALIPKEFSMSPFYEYVFSSQSYIAPHFPSKFNLLKLINE